jgi:hypothetical protein
MDRARSDTSHGLLIVAVDHVMPVVSLRRVDVLAHGVQGFTADVLSHNAMLKLWPDPLRVVHPL